MKRTKVIVTYGPGISDKEILKKVLLNGADGIRLNFSHMEPAEVKAQVKYFRDLEKEWDLLLPLFGDIPGPKVRILNIGKELAVQRGQTLKLSRENFNFPSILSSMKKGDRLLFDDGKISAKVIKKAQKYVEIVFSSKGILKARKGVSFPDTKLELPTLSKRDLEFVEVAVKADIDYLFLSFTCTAEGIIKLKRKLHELGADIPVIAKIETNEGIKNRKDIAKAADGILVARGDLGIETDIAILPVVQDRLIKSANKLGKISMVATEVLDSMILNKVPLRAEISDISKMVEEEVDIVLLTSETSIGKNPVKVIKVLSDVLRKNERIFLRKPKKRIPDISSDAFPQTAAITRSIYANATENSTDLIITVSRTGLTSRLLSKYRPYAPIIMASDERQSLRRAVALWNVFPFYQKKIFRSTDAEILSAVSRNRGLKPGDKVIISRGRPQKISGSTNSFSVFIVKDSETFISGGKKVSLDTGKCMICGKCIDICAFSVFKRKKGIVEVADENLCIGEGLCLDICPRGAIKIHGR